MITVYQVLLVTAFLAVWQYVPQIPGVQDFTRFLDPYFISSPSRIISKLIDLSTGRNGSPLVWSYAEPTLWAAVLGTVIGMVGGGCLGLLLSNFAVLSGVLQPFVVAANATPRVALIPIVAILFGPTLTATVIVSIMVVFFVAFFNAYEGGLTVPSHMIQSSRLLGARNWEVLLHVRMPFVLAWTLAAMPLGITFAIISVVTAELVLGYPGMGRLLATASATADSSLTFAVAIFLAVIGVAVVTLADTLKSRILHWWTA
jgi:NitT/TauT family transport system permease protein